MDPIEYIDKLQQALTMLEEIKTRVADAQAQLEAAAGVLLHQHAPTNMESYHGGDILRADQHLDSIHARLVVLQSEARTAIKALRTLDKTTVKLDYGIGKLYADIRTMAAQERERQANAQQELPGTEGSRRARGRKSKKEVN